MIRQTFSGAWAIVRRSLRVIKNDPHILIYPYLAILFILFTSPLVGRFVINTWHRVNQPRVIDEVSQAAPHQLLAHLGLVTFSVFYTLFITSFFNCMMAASTLAELDGRKPSLFYGLKVVLRRLVRVTLFSLLAIFFFPMGIIAQRQKLKSPRGIFEAISSSFSLSMSQLAPAVVSGEASVMSTVRHSINTLGHLWKESLLIRIGLFIVILLFGLLSFVPKLVEHYWFDSSSSHFAGWVVTTLLGASGYVLIKVIGTVFTATLYHEAKQIKKA